MSDNIVYLQKMYRMAKKFLIEEEQKLEILKYYKKHGVPFISKILKISNNLIYKVLKEKNITIKKQTDYSHRKYSLNEYYFEKIDTKDKAYFLGLLIADGNKYKNTVRIELQEKDKSILELFKKYIEYKGNLTYIAPRKNKKSNALYNITLHSKIFSKHAEKAGIVSNKTFKTTFPNIPEEFHSHFIRGYFDGDGSIWLNNIKQDTWGFNITGNIILIDKIKEVLVKNCLIFSPKTHKKGDKGVGTFCSAGNKQVSRIREYLYKDCDDLYLTRKKEKFDKVSYKIYPKICKFCENKVEAKGLCSKHYHQNIYLNKIKSNI